MAIERIILTTGGTGGHIFPAIAVAEELRRRNPEVMILFIGSKQGVEADIAVNAGLDYAGLPVRGVMGKGPAKALGGLLSMLRSISKGIAIIRKVQPQIIVGFGGYAAFAATFAGVLSKKPTAIHEQNSFPGMANRMLGKKVNRIFVSFPNTTAFAEDKTIFTGNPVRSGIAEIGEQFDARMTAKEAALADTQSQALAPRRLLVLGGSLGASAINRGMQEILMSLLENGVEVWHQTGKNDVEEVRAAYRSMRAEHVRVEAFIHDMPKAYEWADLVLCRAGASTLAEITAVGLPAILVPFPYAAQDHQRYNARYLEQKGAAVVLEQAEFSNGSAERLATTILALMKDPARLLEMSRFNKALGHSDAAALIVDALEKLLPR